jgi:hypothetical protein
MLIIANEQGEGNPTKHLSPHHHPVSNRSSDPVLKDLWPSRGQIPQGEVGPVENNVRCARSGNSVTSKPGMLATHAEEGMESAAAVKSFHRSGGHCVIKNPHTMILVEVNGSSADVCQFGFVFPCVHLPSVHVPAYAEPCHIPTKHKALMFGK